MSKDILRLQCQCCDTTFEVLRLPVEISKMVEIVQSAICPECGVGAKELLIDARPDIVADYPLSITPDTSSPED